MTVGYTELPEQVVVGYASESHALLAEVICLPCWHASPQWREVYPYQVPAAMAHHTVCAHCEREPGMPEVGQAAGAGHIDGWTDLARDWRRSFSFYTSTDEVLRTLGELIPRLQGAGLGHTAVEGAVARLCREVERDRQQPNPLRDEEASQ